MTHRREWLICSVTSLTGRAESLAAGVLSLVAGVTASRPHGREVGGGHAPGGTIGGMLQSDQGDQGAQAAFTEAAWARDHAATCGPPVLTLGCGSEGMLTAGLDPSLELWAWGDPWFSGGAAARAETVAVRSATRRLSSVSSANACSRIASRGGIPPHYVESLPVESFRCQLP